MRLVVFPFRAIYNSNSDKAEIPILKLLKNKDDLGKGLKIDIQFKKTILNSLEPPRPKSFVDSNRHMGYEEGWTTDYKYELRIPIEMTPGNCRTEKETAKVAGFLLKDGHEI